MIKLKQHKALTLMAVIGLGWAWQHHVNQSMSEINSIEESEFRDSHKKPIPSTERNRLSEQLEHSSLSEKIATSHNNSEDPKSSEVDVTNKLNQARTLIDSGQLEEGAKQLEELIKEDPSNTSAMMELAMLYTLDFKEPSRAKGVLERLLDVAPEHRAALAELDLIYRETGTVEEGLETLQLKSQQNPQSKELQFAYGKLLAQSNPAAAIPWLKRGTEISDLREDALNDLAATALRAGQISIAIESWSESLKLAESALEQAKLNGEPGIDYLEERVASTRSELNKAKSQTSRQ